MSTADKIALGALAVGIAAFLWARKHTKSIEGDIQQLTVDYSNKNAEGRIWCQTIYKNEDRGECYCEIGDFLEKYIRDHFRRGAFVIIIDEDGHSYKYDSIEEYEGISGIGATKPKRRIWKEVEQAQRAGVDLTDKGAWQKHMPLLRKMAQGRIKEDGSTPMEQRYFNQLSRAYKSIAGTTLPHDETIIRNEFGDVILIYNDYHMDKLPEQAAKWLYDENENKWTGGMYSAYELTVSAIALGRVKFVWKGSKNNIHRGAEELVFGKSAPAERKQRISYLASPEKGGIYPETWAHRIWEMWDQNGDTQEITDGVLEAIRNCPSVGWAREHCVSLYLKAFQVSEPLLYQDVPF